MKGSDKKPSAVTENRQCLEKALQGRDTDEKQSSVQNGMKHGLDRGATWGENFCSRTERETHTGKTAGVRSQRTGKTFEFYSKCNGRPCLPFIVPKA